MASDNIMMKHVAPALGVLVACMLFASPLKAVKGVRQTRQLGVRAFAAENVQGTTLGRPSTSLQHDMQAALQRAFTVVDVSHPCTFRAVLADSCVCTALLAAEPEPPPIHRHVGQLCGMASVCIPHNRPIRLGIQCAWSAHRQLHGGQLLWLCR